MTERRLSFTADMILATLDGRKTQTRRIPTLHNSLIDGVGHGGRTWAKWWKELDWNGAECVDGTVFGVLDRNSGERYAISPRMEAGDVILATETWRVGAWDPNRCAIGVDYRADGFSREEWLKVPDEEMFTRLWQQSTDDAIKAGVAPDAVGEYHWEPGQSPCRWRPPMFMPRRASRIRLLVNGVRPEHLQDMTDEDAIAEGIVGTDAWQAVTPGEIRDHTQAGMTQRQIDEPIEHGWSDYIIAAFRRLWDSINAKRGYSWKSNPWVWVVEFERVGT